MTITDLGLSGFIKHQRKRHRFFFRFPAALLAGNPFGQDPLPISSLSDTTQYFSIDEATRQKPFYNTLVSVPAAA